MSLDFYQDRPHACSYLEDRLARNIYPDPLRPLTNTLYSQLIQHGFRRSGEHVYRPFCPACDACVPVRIDVNNFRPNRSQRRCLRNNNDIDIVIKPANFNAEHYELYQRYLAHRHPGGGMDNPSKETYLQFLTSSWSDTAFIEFRAREKLLAVAITDFVTDAASAFYTFFDPELSARSLGTFAILKQVELAQQQNLSWLYLGYWIGDSPKMRYKSRFSALQQFNGQWQNCDKKTLNNQ
ncbi:MAG: arginyltransferase [Methylophaga sp.]|jgi:arginine-tRNA-protein transferase|nr:arginyltransferase [Methylophaga sp. UBA5100]MAK67152.1 arginyltransferase [Methylophaga sp.]MAY18190.1 arginyltransferase [Methylophaga sp.]HAO25114.1 arginyltransferase [Methylophaga sp.]|tara:strand:- start:89886 stop:90599 length:714 start_codon:yes stop_codon:yes gene_type:complete